MSFHCLFICVKSTLSEREYLIWWCGKSEYHVFWWRVKL